VRRAPKAGRRGFTLIEILAALAVELTAALADGYAAAARAFIVLLPQDSQPYRVLVWKPLPSSVLR
jgi:general secretion pathway protein K